MKTKIDKIYIVHMPELIDRQEALTEQLSKFNFDSNNIEWRFTYYKHNIPQDIKDKYYKQDIDIYEKNMMYVPGYKRGMNTYLYLSDNYMAVMLEHVFAFEKMIKDNAKIAMIIEDDILFCDDFSDKIVHYMNQLPPDWDIFYPGEACNQRLQQVDINKNVYLHPQKLTRTSCCYIVKIETIKKIIKTIIPFTLPIDFEMIAQNWQHNLNVYWGEPGLTQQGSETGRYKSLFR